MAQVVVQAAQAEDMGSDGDSEVSDGDEATNTQLQQQYLQGGGFDMMGGGAAAAPAPARAGQLSFCSFMWPCLIVTHACRRASGRGRVYHRVAQGQALVQPRAATREQAHKSIKPYASIKRSREFTRTWALVEHQLI